MEGSWNHEYFGSLAKLTWSPSGFTYFARDPKYSWFGLHVNFARDPKYSWFHEPSKNRIHFLNVSGYTCPFHTIWSLTAVSSLSFNTSYCLAECSLLNDCMGVTIFGNTCSLLANNGSLLQQDVNATSAIYMEKNCEQGVYCAFKDA